MMLNDEEKREKLNEFYSRLMKLVEENPSMPRDDARVVALLDEYRTKYDLHIKLVDPSDMSPDDLVNMLKRAAGILKSIKAEMEDESMDTPNEPSLLDPCKYHDPKLDTTNRNVEITKSDVANLAIDLQTKSDEDIWKMFE